MEQEIREINGITIVYFFGDLDLYNAPELKEFIMSLIENNKIKIIINMKEVTYIDSSGIGVLITTLTKIKQKNGAMKISSLSSSVKKVFELTKLTSFFDFCETETDALESF